MAGIKQPADRSHFLLPDLGEGLAEAELVRWLIEPGQAVEEGQNIAEMQTDKALSEVPSPWSGTVSELCGKPGDIIKVGSVLVRYGGAKGATAKAAPAATAAKPQATASAAPAAKPSAKAESAASPAAEADQGTVVGSVGGTLTVSDRFARNPQREQAAAAAGKALATPAVRRIARELNVKIDAVPGSGRGGRVTASDVEGFARGGAAPARRAVATAPQVDAQGISQRIPFRGVRRKIAQALSHSVQTCVHFTATDEADVTALDAMRRRQSAARGTKLSLLPFVAQAVCEALRVHPSLNAIVDDEAGEILIKGVINLGFAVDTDAGLMVPVVRDADRKSAAEMAQSITTLAARCRDRSITREESLGGTFTISNVGSYGALFATPIINYPEVAILAVGRAHEKVMVEQGRFYAGVCLPLSLSCDHRVVDGAEGARFLKTLVGILESPQE